MSRVYISHLSGLHDLVSGTFSVRSHNNQDYKVQNHPLLERFAGPAPGLHRSGSDPQGTRPPTHRTTPRPLGRSVGLDGASDGGGARSARFSFHRSHLESDAPGEGREGGGERVRRVGVRHGGRETGRAPHPWCFGWVIA